MYQNLKVQGLGGFSGNDYWSSSEDGTYYAWYQYFNDGFQNSSHRGGEYRVRPVRAF
jgi:hypothetical protein